MTESGKLNMTQSVMTTSEFDGSAADTSAVLEAPMIANNAPTKPMIKGVKYAFYTKRFWQYFVLMIISTYFAEFFAYSFKTYGESDSTHE